MKFQKITALIFLLAVFLCGVLTIVPNIKIMAGGLYRGYQNSSQNDNVFQKIGNSFGEFEKRVNSKFVLHDQSVNMYGLTQKTLGKNLVDDVEDNYSVVHLKNNYLCFKGNEKEDYTDFGKYLININDLCKNEGVDLLYIQYLEKDTGDQELLPDFYPYVYPSATEKLNQKIRANNIPVLNIESVIEKREIDKYSLFFKTDHHWLPKTGMWVSGLITKEINKSFDSYSLETDLSDISMYNVETYKKSFLGTQGSRVGKYYGLVDDFDIITPKNKTDYHYEIKDENVILDGSFEDVFIHREHLTPEDLLNDYTTAYEVYMEGNHSLVEIENKRCKNDKKALIVMDSYGCVVAPFLAQSFSELDCVDLRYYSDSLEEYIKESKPDIVIYMCKNYQ